mgnify:CR=1 FL=1
MAENFDDLNYMNNGLIGNSTEFYPGKLIELQQDNTTFSFKCNNAVILVVKIITDNIIRFRFATEGYFEEDFSYAIDKENCKIDWSKSGVEIYNHIRGLSPYPASWTILKDGENGFLFDLSN